MRALFRITFAALLTAAALAQTPAPQPAFEDADVHVSPNSSNPFARPPFLGRNRYESRNATMADLIARAYSTDPDKVVGGPNWLEYDRFDVIAKTPPNTTQDGAKQMMQKLLADRFMLFLHKDTQQMPALALVVVGKGKPKLKEAEKSEQTGCKNNLPTPGRGGAPGPMPIPPTLTFNCRNMTIAAFAAGMRTMLGAAQYIGTKPVEDKTGLEGAWDFDLKFSLPMIVFANADNENISFEEALEKQLGLRLEPEKIPQGVIVVDSVNRKPTLNSPDIGQKLPALPTEFEVATVKPTAVDLRGIRMNVRPGGRVDIAGMPLMFLVQQAWSIPNDRIVGAPKWMDSDRFDILATMPDDGSVAGPVNMETVFPLLRNLLADRFKLVTHMEDRPMTAYNLVAVKPKLKKADPNSRTKWTQGPAAVAAALRTVTFQNMTMAQFVEALQNIGNFYIRTPILDATGLEGGYDFTLSFNPIDPAQFPNAGGRGGAPGQDAPQAPGVAQASDPSGTVTLFDAVEKQLGLKLEATKRPVSVLVIDHINQTPTEN